MFVCFKLSISWFIGHTLFLLCEKWWIIVHYSLFFYTIHVLQNFLINNSCLERKAFAIHLFFSLYMYKSCSIILTIPYLFWYSYRFCDCITKATYNIKISITIHQTTEWPFHFIFNYFSNILSYHIQPLLASLATSEHSRDIFKDPDTVSLRSHPGCYSLVAY